MPSIRIGFSSEFVLRNELVGIGSTATSERLDVAGQIRSENTAGSGGVSTFREYQGFSQVEANVTNNITIDNGSGGPYSSLTGEIKITGETTVSSGSTVEVGKTKTLTVTDRFAVPLGETNNRDNAPEAGTTRFNQDFGTLEFFDGINWKTVNSYNRSGAGRGYFAGGDPGGVNNKRIATVLIQTLGSATNFGELEDGRQNGSTGGALSSSTRALVSGGFISPAATSDVEYFALTSTGNAVDFGNLRVAVRNHASCASSTRGLFGGGEPGPSAEITYVEIATTGDSLNFGDLTVARNQITATSSPTRGVFIAGEQDFQVMDYVIIASKGDAIDFGDLSKSRDNCSGVSNGVRGVIGSGFGGPGASVRVKTMDYITFASQGNAIDFGERSEEADTAATCDSTRGIFKSDFVSPSKTTSNVVDYITIASAGNAIDWGDFVDSGSQTMGNMSDSHGGLGGF